MTISDIEYGCALFLSGATGFSLTWLFLANARRKAENEGLLKLYDSLKEELDEWEDCEPELEALRKSFASMNEFLAAENGRLLDFSVRLDAIDFWIQSKAPQPPTRNAKGRFTKRKK